MTNPSTSRTNRFDVGPTHLISHKLPTTSFFRVLNASYNPSSSTGQTTDEEMLKVTLSKDVDAKKNPPPGPLLTQVYHPHGAWAWAEGLFLRRSGNMIQLPGEKKTQSQTYYTAGVIGGRQLQLMCTSWPLQKSSSNFVPELALYKVQLKPLQGFVVPTIIGVFTGIDRVDIAMELPHHSFWIQASPDMPDILKKKCVEAFEKLHKRGVCHGNPKPSNILIGGDACITIINFHSATALVPDATVYLKPAKPEDLRLELRKVKYMLDYEDARDQERKKYTSTVTEKLRKPVVRNPLRVLIPEDETKGDGTDLPLNMHERRGWVLDTDFVPERFIVPGQTPQEYEKEFRQFLNTIRRMESEQSMTRDSRLPSTSPPPELGQRLDVNVDTILLTLPSETNPPTPPRYSLRKRKLVAEDGAGVPSPKRVRTGNHVTFSAPAAGSPAANPSGAKANTRDTALHISIHDNNLNRKLPGIRVRDFAFEGYEARKVKYQGHLAQSDGTMPAGPSRLGQNGKPSDRLPDRGKGKRKRDEDERIDCYSESGKPKRIRASGGTLPLSATNKRRVSFVPGASGRTRTHQPGSGEDVRVRSGAFADALALHQRHSGKTIRQPRPRTKQSDQVEFYKSRWDDGFSGQVISAGHMVASWFRPGQNMETVSLPTTPLVLRSVSRWFGNTLRLA